MAERINFHVERSSGRGKVASMREHGITNTFGRPRRPHDFREPVHVDEPIDVRPKFEPLDEPIEGTMRRLQDRRCDLPIALRFRERGEDLLFRLIGIDVDERA